jgi:hypothetical protein
MDVIIYFGNLGCGDKNYVISNRSINKLVIDTFRKNVIEQRNNLMLGLALNGLGSAYSLPL